MHSLIVSAVLALIIRSFASDLPLARHAEMMTLGP